MPGAETPAAVRYARYSEMVKENSIITDTNGKQHCLCMACGTYSGVGSHACDHFESRESIFENEESYLATLNKKNTIQKAKKAIEAKELKGDYLVHKGKICMSLKRVKRLYNDYGNLWLICNGCNTSKKAQDSLEWLKKQPFYNKEFTDFLEEQELTKKGALTRAGRDKKGLATTAIEYFRTRWATYQEITQDVLENILFPQQKKAKKADTLKAKGKLERAGRHGAAAGAAQLGMKAIALSKILPPGPPKPKQSSSKGDQSKTKAKQTQDVSTSESDEDEHLKWHDSSGGSPKPFEFKSDSGSPINLSPESTLVAYNKAAVKAAEKLPGMFENTLGKEYLKAAQEIHEQQKDKPAVPKGKRRH